MDREELRAITAAGPSVIMADRKSLLGLLDALAAREEELAMLKRQNRVLGISLAFATGMWLWFLIYKLTGGL
jgi:hypothetical protein